MAVILVATSLLKPGPLSDQEWQFCQTNYELGLDAGSTGSEATDWYFQQMWNPSDPETIRVCEAAWAKSGHGQQDPLVLLALVFVSGLILVAVGLIVEQRQRLGRRADAPPAPH